MSPGQQQDARSGTTGFRRRCAALPALPGTLLIRLDDAITTGPRAHFGDWRAAVLLLGPALLILGAFGIAPLFTAVGMSFYAGRYGLGDFVGLSNYAEAFASPDFWNSVLVTLYYVGGTLSAAILFSFCVAYALYRIVFARAFFRLLYFLPYVTSAVAAAMVWRGLLNPQFGPVNSLLRLAGLPAQNWLLEPRGVLHLLSGGILPESLGPSLALCCIMVFDIWHASGFMIVIFLAGLSAIPREFEEAARIDGAGALQRIRYVVLPLLSPTLFFLLIVGAIKAFQAFNSFYALTQGGSHALGTTQNLVLHIYANFYEYGYWGYGAAVATLLTMLIVLLTVVQWRFIGRRVHYQ